MELGKKQTLILKFKISGNLVYLSHKETVSMFQRSLVRAQVNLCYSEGFNPRPRLSLPIPRSVGMRSDDELLCVVMSPEVDGCCVDELKGRICGQLPAGCEIISAALAEGKVSFVAQSAVYEIDLIEGGDDEKIRENVDRLRTTLAGNEPIIIERNMGPKKPMRRIDIAGYIDSVECRESGLIIKCKIGSAGAARIDEILRLLQIDTSQLSAPVKRKSVQWRNN